MLSLFVRAHLRRILNRLLLRLRKMWTLYVPIDYFSTAFLNLALSKAAACISENFSSLGMYPPLAEVSTC